MGRITRVEVEYRELRSSGSPDFTNKTYGTALRAQVHAEDDYVAMRERLMREAVDFVQGLHGDNIMPWMARLALHPIQADVLEHAIATFIAGTWYIGDVPGAAKGVMAALQNPMVLEVIRNLAMLKAPERLIPVDERPSFEDRITGRPIRDE